MRQYKEPGVGTFLTLGALAVIVNLAFLAAAVAVVVIVVKALT
jgi:hypothetical protein